MSKRAMDLLSAVVLGVLAIFLHLNARGIAPRFKTGVDSGFFPEVVTILLIVLVVAIAVRAVMSKGETSAGAAMPARDDAVDTIGLPPRVLGTIALMAVTIFFMPFIGFVLASAIFLFLQMLVLTPAGGHQYALKAAISIAMTISVYFIFSKGFGLILPSWTL